MTAKNPIFEATQTATTAITDLMRKLFLVKPLAMVYPETKTSSVHYRTGESVGKYLFPFSLPCIIYAVFHRNDDPEFFDAVNAMVAGKSRYSYDPLTKRLKPNVTLPEGAGVPERLKEALKFRMDTKLGSMETLEEGSDIVAGYLTSPHILTDDVGRDFEATLVNIIDHAAPGEVGDAMYDRLGKVKKKSVAEYINDLAIKRLDPDGRVLPKPKYGNKASWDEISVYIACRMAEHFADDVLESAEDIESAKKLISILTYADDDTSDTATERDLESAIGKVNAERLYSDALQYATEWITDEGKVKGKRERLTGSGATEYVPLDVENRNDLIRAYVAPKYVINMFACDCRKFIPADGWKTDKAVSSESINRAGIGLIAKALELPANSTADDINTYIRTELVPDTQTAKEVRANAIEFVKKYLMSDDEVTHQLAANILRHVFQVKGDDDYTRTPGIGGEGDEIRYRKTGVALNNIKSKIISKFPPSSGKYMVVADNRPTSGDLSDEHDTFTVDIDGIEKEVSRSDRKTLDTYERPELVKFEDNDTSYPVYAIWEGIVPYSKVVDNKPTYDISQSPETVAAREGSAEDLIKGAMQSVKARSPMGALGVKSIPSGHPLTHDELMEIGNGIKSLDETKYSGILPDGADGSNNEVLRDYMLLTAIKYYNGKLNDYNSKAGNGTDDTYARKDAVMSVMGNPDVMISASPDYDNLIERISDAADDYASARAVSGDQGELAVGDTVRAYLDDYFNFVEDEDVPALLKDNYGSDKRSILRDLRLYVGDLLNTAIKVVSGYGYRGIRLTNSYSGGRYSFNNRLTVRDAAFNYPIGNFKETEYTKSVRDNIIDNVLNPVASALDWMLSQPGRAVDALNRIAENGKSKDIIDASVTDSSVKSVIDAVGEEGKGLALAYGILRGTIVGDQMFTRFVQMLSNGSAKRGISAIRPQVTTKELSDSITNLNKEMSNPATDLGKAAQLLMYIQRLSDGGEDFRPIRELLGNEPGNVGKTTRLIYGKLMGAIDSCRRTAERVGGLEKDLLKTGSIDMGLRQNVGEDVDLTTVEGEDALADVAAAEDNGSDVNETVESGLEDWDGTKSYGTYLGLSGYAGIDTIKAGESGGYDMASSLADRESVGEGLSPYYVGICSRMIDDAVNSHEKLLANGPKAEFAMTSRNIKAWADKVISIASSYMLSRNKLDITGVTEDRKHKIDPDDALDWKKMTSVVLREIEQMCTDAVPDDAMVVADEIVKMIKDLDISRATLESISQVSTALAHMILKLGEISNSAQESDPLAGVSDSAAIPTGVLDMAKVRAMQGKSTRGIKQGAKEGDDPDFLTTVKNQMDGDSDLAKLISNLYETYGRDATEGYANALGAMDAAAHAAENKTYRAKTELRGGVAPTQFAAMLYGLVWDAEQAGDAKYTNILKTINALSDAKSVAVPVPANERNKTAETKNVRFTINGDEATPEQKAEAPVLVVDVITMADLDERVNIGDNAGRTYAECAFGSPDEKAMPIGQAIEQDPALGRKLAAALRVQMVDRLLSDSTFSSMRENDELWDKFSDRVTKQALDLNGTSSAMLFVTLDHAILNLGREVRQKELQQKIKDDTALGEEFASERMVTKNTEGGSDTITVGEEPLTAAIRQCLFGQSEERRKDGKKALSDLIGIHLADEFLSSLDKAEITKRFKSGEKAIDIAHEYAVSLIEKYGKTPEQMASEGKESDRKFRRAVATIKMGLYAIATGKPDANGISPDKYKDTRLPDIMGKKMSDALVNELMTRLDKYPNADDRTVGRIVDRLVDQVLHSSSNVVHALMKYAGINTDTRSNVSRWSAMRETGGLTSSGSYKAEKSETKRRAKLIVEEELNKLDPESSDSERKRLYRILNQVGFIGSIDDFCNQVKEGVPQDALAHKFASDDQNYQSAFRSMISGKYSAVTPSDSVASDELVLDVARGMERLGRHGMTMVHDADGEEEPFVMFSNSQTPRSLRAGYAARQLELLMDEYKRKYGESFTDENGETTDAKIKKLDDMMQHAATPYPVNPVATTKELVPLVVGILNNDIVPGGRHWATVMGGAHGHHTYKLEIERGENHFIALVAERLVETTIKSIARESGDDITLSKIMQELMRLRRYNKAEVLKSGILTKLADTVKKRISSRIESRINTMVKNGVAETSDNGIYVIWENAPAPKPDGDPEPTSGKSAATAPGGKPATGVRPKRAATKKRAATPVQTSGKPAQPEDNGASESEPKTT